MKLGLISCALFVLAACGTSGDSPAPVAESDAPPPGASSSTSNDAPPATTAPAPTPAPAADPTLHIKFLGVQGFLVEYGNDAVLSAPLYTRPSMIEVTAGFVESDANGVDAHLTKSDLKNVRAVIAGHAHYDHLLDAPVVLDRASGATLYSNISARNILAAFAPDRAAKCAGASAPPFTIARSRVVAMDDPAASVVDYTNCPTKKPEGAPTDGKWVSVPNSNVRVLAVCSEHPAQIGPYHYGEGDVTEEKCTAPDRMDDWKEGLTLAFLVDFLDPTTKQPVFRFFYQDAPSNGAIGHVPASFLAAKRVDAALLCIGSSNNVANEPAGDIDAIGARYVIGGHWEDFFRSADDPPQPITFLDVGGWAKTARDAVAKTAPEPKDLMRNGQNSMTRALAADPNDTFEIAR